MSKYRFVAETLSLSALFAAVGCSGLAPNHHARFIFQGKVTDKAGKPIPNALVKVSGWETLTDNEGHWRQEQFIHCGTLRTEITGTESPDQILIMAPGFESAEENFLVKHPGYFKSCNPDQTIALETKLETKLAAKAKAAALDSAPAKNPENNEEHKWSAPKKRSAEEVSL